MAAKKNTATTEPETEAVDYSTKVKPLHEAHSAYIEDQTGIKVDPLHIFLVYSTRVPFRKTSEQYQDSKAAAAEAKEAAAKAKEEAKAEKAKAREEAKAAKEAEKKAKAEAAAKEVKEETKASKTTAAKKTAEGKKKPF